MSGIAVVSVLEGGAGWGEVSAVMCRGSCTDGVFGIEIGGLACGEGSTE